MHVFSSWKKKIQIFLSHAFRSSRKIIYFQIKFNGFVIKIFISWQQNFYFDLNLKNFIFDAQTIAEFD